MGLDAAFPGPAPAGSGRAGRSQGAKLRRCSGPPNGHAAESLIAAPETCIWLKRSDVSRPIRDMSAVELETRERRSLAAIEAELRILKDIALERAARRSVTMDPEPAVPLSGAAGRK